MPTDTERLLVENAAAFGMTQADIAAQLKISEPTLRKRFRKELNSGKFKVAMTAGRTVIELLRDPDSRVRLDAAKWYTARRMGWKETTVTEQTGKDGGPIEVSNVSAIDVIREQIASATERLEDKSGEMALGTIAEWAKIGSNSHESADKGTDS